MDISARGTGLRLQTRRLHSLQVNMSRRCSFPKVPIEAYFQFGNIVWCGKCSKIPTILSTSTGTIQTARF